jgi:hypothetical protein
VATSNPLDGTATNSAAGTTIADGITTGSAPTTVTGPVTNGSHVLTAVARDGAGNQTTSVPVTVTVGNGPTPPVIPNVTWPSIVASGATIGWTTDEASDSQVEFGLTTGTLLQKLRRAGLPLSGRELR